MKPFRLVSVALLLAVSGLIAAVRGSDLVYTFHHEQVLGTSFELKVVAPSAAIAARAEAAAIDEIARNARILSSYDPDSEFSRWFRTRGVPTQISPELFDVLSLFDRWRARSSGALDPAAEAATRLWKTAAAQHRIPADAGLALLHRLGPTLPLGATFSLSHDLTISDGGRCPQRPCRYLWITRVEPVDIYCQRCCSARPSIVTRSRPATAHPQVAALMRIRNKSKGARAEDGRTTGFADGTSRARRASHQGRTACEWVIVKAQPGHNPVPAPPGTLGRDRAGTGRGGPHGHP